MQLYCPILSTNVVSPSKNDPHGSLVLYLCAMHLRFRHRQATAAPTGAVVQSLEVQNPLAGIHAAPPIFRSTASSSRFMSVGAYGAHWRFTFGFPENPDDLLFTEFALFHGSAAFLFRSRTPPLSRPSLRGQVTMICQHLSGGMAAHDSPLRECSGLPIEIKPVLAAGFSKTVLQFRAVWLISRDIWLGS